MKRISPRFNLKTAWVCLFSLFFLCIPLSLLRLEFCFAALFVVTLFALCKFEVKRFSVLLFSLALILRIIVVLAVPTPPESDFAVLFDASQQIIAGDRSYLETSYFQLWAYQLGFAYFQSIFLRIWNSVLILKLLNCLLGAATTVLVYLIAREFVSKKASQAAGLIYCCLPFTLCYVTILSNQFIASFLIYLGIYILISKRLHIHTHLRYLLYAILLALANVMRPESIIPLFSACIYLVLTLKKATLKQSAINLIILLAVYFGLTKLIGYLFVISGISPLGLTNNDPLWKFVLGFNHETGGKYTDKDSLYLQNESALELIRSRIFVPLPQLISLFVRKIQTFWCGSGIEWSFIPFYNSGLTILGKTFALPGKVAFLNSVSRWIMIFLYGFILLGIASYLRNKNRNSSLLLIITQVFVTFGVYLLIEVQPRYFYHIQISVVILAALGIQTINRGSKKLFAYLRQTRSHQADKE